MFSAAIHIDDHLLSDFFRYLFPPDSKGGPCVVSVAHPVGALMVALAEASPAGADTSGEGWIPVDLPKYSNATTSLVNHYVQFSAESASRILLALKASFELDFQGYYRRGEQLGIQKKDIIEAYIFSRGLAPEEFSAMHKRVYRRQQRAREDIRRRLVRKAYYIDESINYQGLISEK